MEGKGGEFRIMYFLSRSGRIEQPHLIRIEQPHLHTNGLYLRDVKKWLSDLRGKTMPDSFSWSYKRRYSKGYVWQDLQDDDLITPISDNEFVLKGSEIEPSSHDHSLYKEEKGCGIKEEEQETALSGSERWSVMDESIEEGEENKNSETSSSSSILLKNTNNNDKKKKKKKDDAHITIKGSKRRLFRNLLRCGAADTNDSVMVMVMRSKNNNQHNDHQICKGHKLGMGDQQNTRRSHDGTKKQSQSQSQSQSSGHNNKPVYRPVRGPTCSQCGKSFKPEKLHKHMKSCRGLRAMARNAAQKHTNKSPTSTTESSYTHLLTN